MYIAASHDNTPGFERDFVNRTIAFYNDELYLRGRDGTLTKVDAPNSAQKSVHRDWLMLELREPYSAGGTTYKAGSLIATKFDDFMAGKREFDVLFEPDDHSSLAGATWTKHAPRAERARGRQEPPERAHAGPGRLGTQRLHGCAGVRHAGRHRGRSGRERRGLAHRHRLPHAHARCRSRPSGRSPRC